MRGRPKQQRTYMAEHCSCHCFCYVGRLKIRMLLLDVVLHSP